MALKSTKLSTTDTNYRYHWD